MRRSKGSGGSSCRPRRETDRPFQLTAGGETARGAPPRYCELAAAETHIYIFLLTQRFVHSGVAAWDGALVAPDREPVFRCVAALAILPALRRNVDGRYKDAPPHEWFNHLALSVAGTPKKGFQGYGADFGFRNHLVS